MKLFYVYLFVPFLAFGSGFFEEGHHYLSKKFSGEVKYTCFIETVDEGIPVTPIYQKKCKGQRIFPALRSHFTYNKPIKANKVVFTVYQNGKKIRKKSFRYDSKNGKTKRPVNLFETGQLKFPLLPREGNSTVKYELKNWFKTVASGEIKITIEEREPKRCQFQKMGYIGGCLYNKIRVCEKHFRTCREVQN